MFQGATSLNLDAKGRMAVPARHRDALTGKGLVLTVHPHRCLLLYPEDAWAPIRERILAAPSFDPRSAATTRVLLGNALDVAMDAAGRLLITPELRTIVGLEKQVWLVGMGSHFEVWSDEGWRRQHETAFDALTSTEPPPGFEDLSL